MFTRPSDSFNGGPLGSTGTWFSLPTFRLISNGRATDSRSLRNGRICWANRPVSCVAYDRRRSTAGLSGPPPPIECLRLLIEWNWSSDAELWRRVLVTDASAFSLIILINVLVSTELYLDMVRERSFVSMPVINWWLRILLCIGRRRGSLIKMDEMRCFAGDWVRVTSKCKLH